MIKRLLASSALALGIAAFAAPSASAQFVHSDYTSGWAGISTLMPITATAFSDFSSVSGGGRTLSFSSALNRRDAPGGGWATWSCAPFSSRPCDATSIPVGYSNGATSLTMTFDGLVSGFGFEVEPNPFSVHTFTADFYRGLTKVWSITRGDVDGSAGARLFALSSWEFDRVEFSGTADFALAEFRVSTVPEPGSVALLATGLVGLAAAGLRRRRKDQSPS